MLLEPGRGGAAALHRGAELARELGAELTVVAVAPQAPRPCCGGLSPADYNCAIRDDVVADLGLAAGELQALGADARFELLLEGRDPPLDRFLSERGFGILLLPARRVALRTARHPDARRLSRLAGVEVRVVEA